MLKERVCPLVIRLFSPSIKYNPALSPTAFGGGVAEKPSFPVCLRLLRIVGVLIKYFYVLLVSASAIFPSLPLLVSLRDSIHLWINCILCMTIVAFVVGSTSKYELAFAVFLYVCGQVTECEIFLSLLVKFLEIDKPIWQRVLAVEVLHQLAVQPRLLR